MLSIEWKQACDMSLQVKIYVPWTAIEAEDSLGNLQLPNTMCLTLTP